MSTSTFVSMVSWPRGLHDEAGIRARIDRQEIRLFALGMHSIVFIPGEDAAVVVSNCSDHAAAAGIVEICVGEDLVRVDALRFDEPRRNEALRPVPRRPMPSRPIRERPLAA